MASVNTVFAWRLKVDWNRDNVYTDESAYLVNATGRQSIVAAGDGLTTGRGTVDQATFVLDNATNRFGFFGSTLVTDIGDGNALRVPVTFEVAKGGVYYPVFTGFVKSISQSAWQASQINTVTLDCRSIDDALLQDKRSTPASDFAGWANTPQLEGEIIADLLTFAGYTDGDDFYSAASYPATATIDKGLFRLPWVWLDDESVLEEIWAIAGACGGIFYTDASGVFHYEALDNWLFTGAAVPLTQYTAIAPIYDDRELFSGAIVEMNERRAGAFEVVWEPDAPPVVPPSASNYVVSARLDSPLLVYSNTTFNAVTHGGADITADITTVIEVFAQRVLVKLTNTNTSYAAIIRNLQIVGQPAVGARGEETGLSSLDAFWTGRASRIKSVRGNPYIQTDSQARSMVRFLRDRFEKPRLRWQVSGTEVPELGMGQRVTINETGLGMSAARDGHIIGRQWSAGAGGYVEILDVIDRATLFPFIDASPAGYFIIGTNKLGTSDALRGRVFY
jgi:hypothetical protein